MYSDGRISFWNPKVLLILLLVFCTGGLSGALALRYSRGVRAQVIAPSNNKAAYLSKLEKDLGLTKDQVAQLSLILDDYTRYYQSINDQLEEVRATGKNKIIQVLDAGQREKFLKMMPPDLPR